MRELSLLRGVKDRPEDRNKVVVGGVRAEERRGLGERDYKLQTRSLGPVEFEVWVGLVGRVELRAKEVGGAIEGGGAT